MGALIDLGVEGKVISMRKFNTARRNEPTIVYYFRRFFVALVVLSFILSIILLFAFLMYIPLLSFQAETNLCRRFTAYVLKYELMAQESLIVPTDHNCPETGSDMQSGV